MTRTRKDRKDRVWTRCDADGSWSIKGHTIGCGGRNGSKWQIWSGPFASPFIEYDRLSEAMDACCSNSIFMDPDVEEIVRKLCEAMTIANSNNSLSCQQGVYGAVYSALRTILIYEFGENSTNVAMASSTWDVSDFNGQVIPALEDAIGRR